MPEITKADFETINNIRDSLSTALIEKDPGAVDRFANSLTFKEKTALMFALFRIKFNQNADYEVQTKNLVSYCDKAVPGLARTFGEQTLVDALPAEARTQKMAEFTEKTGGPRIAHLIRQTL
jgi:hypothetical protein